MDNIKLLKSLLMLFLIHPTSRIAWNTSIISLGLGITWMFFILDPEASGASYNVLLGPVLCTIGILGFLYFLRSWFNLVLIKYLESIFQKKNLNEFLTDYGYSPTAQLKRKLKKLEATYKKELKKIRSNQWSPTTEQELLSNYEASIRSAHELDKKIHVDYASSINFEAISPAWWNKRSTGKYFLLFVTANIIISWILTKEAPYVILRNPDASYMFLPYAILIGVLVAGTYNAFKINTGTNYLETAGNTLKVLSFFFIGFLLGSHMFNYGFTGFINKTFGERKSFELTAQHWRQSPRWCEGLEVQYKIGGYLHRKNTHGEQILCFPSMYKTSFKKDSLVFAHGPGTILGLNVKTISSPYNNISEMPTPKWD